MQKPDPIDVPMYSLSAAARWVGVPHTTLHKWVFGRDYPAGGRMRRSKPLIVPADPEHRRLSFANIAEAHLLNVTRKYRIPLHDVRAAIDLVQASQPGAKHPLLTGHFYRRGKYIFVDFLSQKIAASRPIEGQPLLGHEFDEYLERIERDERGKIIRLFPVRRNESKTVVLNSGVAGGQPIIAGTGILVEYVQDLHRIGLSPHKIAAQYGLDESKIVEAINYIAA